MIVEEVDRPDQNVVNQFEAVSPNDLGHHINFGHVDPEIEFLYTTDAVSIVGPAVTVRVPPEDGTMIHKAIDMCRPGDVLMVDAQGHTKNAVWGDFTSTGAKHNEVAGVVIDGSVTDIRDMRDIDVPVYARATTTRTARMLGRGGDINKRIQVGGAVVSPGDLIIGNEDGVLCIPQDEISSAAELISDGHERDLEAELNKGKSLSEISGADKYVEQMDG